MKAEEVLKIYNLLKENDITSHVDGGWGIDALLGRQTRPHNDLDIAVARNDVEKLRNVLKDYKEKKKDGSTEWNFILEDQESHEIDVHVFEFDDKGNNVYGIEYPKDSLTGVGTINGVTVNCIAAEYVIKFHENYEPKEKDLQDIKALCEKFDLKHPKNYDIKADYAEFNDPRLVAIYNTVCPLDGYEKFYLELVKKLSAETIIDIGCGTGLLTGELAKQGHKMIGVEPSNLMLDVARKSPVGKEVKWIQGDAQSLESFNADLVIMTGHVAQFHLEDEVWQNALKSIYKALKPGGYLAFESRNPAVQPWNNKNQENNTDWYAPNLRKKFHDPVAGEIEVWLEIVRVENNKVTTNVHYLFTETGEGLISTNTLIFRTRDEIVQSLKDAGFSIENIYGNWDSRLANAESPEFIFVAKKQA